MNTLPWNPFFQATSIPSPARYFYLLPPLVARALYQCFMRQTPTMIYHTHTTTFHTTSGHCCLILLSVWPKSWLAVFSSTYLPVYGALYRPHHMTRAIVSSHDQFAMDHHLGFDAARFETRHENGDIAKEHIQNGLRCAYAQFSRYI